MFRYRSAQHFIETFRTWYGPRNRAFSALDMAKQVELTRDLTELLQRFNRSGDPTLAVPSEYLEVVATKK